MFRIPLNEYTMKYFLLGIFLTYGCSCFSQLGNRSKIELVEKRGPKLSTPYIDSLKKVLAGANQKQLFEIQFGLFREYLPINKDSSSFYIDKALKQAIILGDSADIVNAYNAKGALLKSDGDVKKAIEVFKYALDIARRNNLRMLVKYLLNNLALSYTLIASYDTALAYNFESLKIREAEGNAKDIYIALHNIGYLYEELGDYENALMYYSKGYDTKIENNVNYDLDKSLINIGMVLNRLGEYKLAELKIREAFDYCDTLKGKSNNLINAFQVMGESLLKQKKFKQAESYFRKSLMLSMKNEISINGAGSIDSKASSLYSLALIKFNEGKQQDAITFLNSSQQVAMKAGLQKQILNNYELYSKLFAEEGDYKKALDYQILYQRLNSDILNVNVLRRISKLHAEFSARENIAKIESQEKLMTLQQETINQHKSLNYLIGIVALLTLGLALIFYRMNWQKQQINKILDRRVRERTGELERNRDELKHAHDEQAIVLKKVSSDLTSSSATLKGLYHVAMHDLLPEQAIYFKEAQHTAERIVNYIRLHIPHD